MKHDQEIANRLNTNIYLLRIGRWYLFWSQVCYFFFLENLAWKYLDRSREITDEVNLSLEIVKGLKKDADN